MMECDVLDEPVNFAILISRAFDYRANEVGDVLQSALEHSHINDEPVGGLSPGKGYAEKVEGLQWNHYTTIFST